MKDSYTDCLIVARSELATAQRLLAAEISAYPTPISGCDAQFNHLLAERVRIADALSQLNASVFVPTPRMPTPADRMESR
ncbi:hypothetical protein [Tateyamaria sp. Alg231-49]|uniref:hypothetical protein n=1 Tax=Tateyamaria sp. Alg231-49 TaxID=1922219 RepID=UPI000D559749|nr:hypothetical protein [Tateyamaria sp. Alg231-49]